MTYARGLLCSCGQYWLEPVTLPQYYGMPKPFYLSAIQCRLFFSSFLLQALYSLLLTVFDILLSTLTSRESIQTKIFPLSHYYVRQFFFLYRLYDQYNICHIFQRYDIVKLWAILGSNQ